MCKYQITVASRHVYMTSSFDSAQLLYKLLTQKLTVNVQVMALNEDGFIDPDLANQVMDK